VLGNDGDEMRRGIVGGRLGMLTIVCYLTVLRKSAILPRWQ